MSSALKRQEFFLSKAVETAGFVVNFLKLEWPYKEDLKDRDGGCLSYGTQEGKILFIEKIREVSPEKVEKYHSLAPEKVGRLARHPKHMLSSESRDPEKNQWGGAVRGDVYLRGFSGLTEQLDEIAMLGLALTHEDLTWDEVERLLVKHYPLLPHTFVPMFKAMAGEGFEYGHLL
jgi:hypothetical protein